MDIKLRAVVILAAALGCSTAAFAERGFTNEFLSGATRPKSIALLPAEATITRQQVVETTGLVDESVVFGAQFNANLFDPAVGRFNQAKLGDLTKKLRELRPQHVRIFFGSQALRSPSLMTSFSRTVALAQSTGATINVDGGLSIPRL